MRISTSTLSLPVNDVDASSRQAMAADGFASLTRDTSTTGPLRQGKRPPRSLPNVPRDNGRRAPHNLPHRRSR